MQYHYQKVCLESLAYTLPDEVVTSAQIEARLAPLYRRLRLPEGRLELMSGISQRRFWPPDTLPSTKSAETAEKALEAAGIDRRQVGALVHGSVCRDFLEPATACGVHHRLGLPRECAVYDVSNACLGLLNGALQVANMIELGQIRAGVVVGTESSRDLVEATIAELNADRTLSRQDIKPAFASLTIGSGSAALVLVDRDLSRRGNRLLGGAVRAGPTTSSFARAAARTLWGTRRIPTGRSRLIPQPPVPSPSFDVDRFGDPLARGRRRRPRNLCRVSRRPGLAGRPTGQDLLPPGGPRPSQAHAGDPGAGPGRRLHHL